jgi:hypothetical protein
MTINPVLIIGSAFYTAAATAVRGPKIGDERGCKEDKCKGLSSLYCLFVALKCPSL